MQVGLRRRTYNVLAGSVLSVWSRVENILSSKGGYGSHHSHGSNSNNNKMQVIRLKTTEGIKIVGTLIPKNCVETLTTDLSSDAENVEHQTFNNKE